MRKLLALCFILLLPAKAWGLDISVETDRTSLSLAETLRLSVSVSAGDFELPPLEAFDVLGRSSSTNISIVNGAFSKTFVQEYQLQPRRIGELTIPAFTVEDGKDKATSQPITIRVTEAAEPDPARDDYFIITSLSNPEPFVGQQFSLTYNIHLGGQLNDPRLVEPEFEGFTYTKLDPREGRTVVNGRSLTLVSITYVLTPLSPGDKRPGPLVLKGLALRPGSGFSSPFDRFFANPFGSAGDYNQVSAASEQPVIHVRPLPEYQGSPPFSGLVGQFDLAAEPRNFNVKTSDSATLTVTLRGKGNLPDAARPELQLPEGVKAYPDQDEDRFELTPEGHQGAKTFRWALVPTRPGEYTLPGLSLVYFDPVAEAYRTLNTGNIVLAAVGDAPSPPPVATAAPGQAPPAEAVELTGHDILPLKEAAALVDRSPMPWPWFWTLLGLPAVLYPALLGLRSRLGREADRRTRLSAKVRESLKAADSAPDPGERLGLLRRALVSAILARTGNGGEALTAAEADRDLQAAGIPGDTAASAAGLLERLETLRYGGSPPSSEELAALGREVRETARRLGA